MTRLATISVVIFASVVFWATVDIAQLFGAIQSITVALSIMVAAILVRLNRGMPSLEWKALSGTERTKLTSRIVELSLEYIWIIAVDTVTLVLIIGMTIVGKNNVLALGERWQSSLSAAVGGLLGLCLARMVYVVWRDYDIIKLQKTLIDGSSSREDLEEEVKTALEKVGKMKSAGLKAVPRKDPRVLERS
jgi:hypothetical protein